MDIINNNPYRIAGILSNATERELQKQKAKIKAYAKVGKAIKLDFDFQILESIDRTEDSVNKAFSNVEQNQDKVNFSLFWFLNASSFDNSTIEYLIKGDAGKGHRKSKPFNEGSIKEKTRLTTREGRQAQPPPALKPKTKSKK